MALRRGFKALAERIALEIRGELALGTADPLDCLALAEHLGIPVVALAALTSDGADVRSIHRLMRRDARFSALTVCVGSRRLIIYNPAAAPGRRANSLAHELSHVILEHPAMPALGDGGCRYWDPDVEDEADWLAAALLVPRDAALTWLSRRGSPETGALHFGVSAQLFNWRINQTGVTRQLEARRQWR